MKSEWAAEMVGVGYTLSCEAVNNAHDVCWTKVVSKAVIATYIDPEGAKKITSIYI